MKQRIWELDALRGICILGMVVVHFIYDLVDLYALVDWQYPAAFLFIRDWGGVLFLLISGICVTLGSRSVRRGLTVFACGMLCTAVTAGMVALGFAGKSMVIWFGILHCLGICMLLWSPMKRLPVPALAVLGILLIGLGFYLDANIRVDFPWLVPLGLRFPGFASSDYFPLLPYLGFFLLGAVLGKTVYRSKTSLLSRVNSQNPILRFLSGCGRHSLWIYLLHQPILTAIFLLFQ